MTIKEKIAKPDCPGTIVAMIIYLFLINCMMVIGIIVMAVALLGNMSTADSLETMIYILWLALAVVIFILQCAIIRWLSQGKKAGFYVTIAYFAISLVSAVFSSPIAVVIDLLCIIVLTTEDSRRYFGVFKKNDE